MSLQVGAGQVQLHRVGGNEGVALGGVAMELLRKVLGWLWPPPKPLYSTTPGYNIIFDAVV